MTRLACLLALLLSAPALAQDAPVPLVEPEMLSRDPNLIGREVTVDDRIRFFQSHKGPGGKQVYDEVFLKRADVIFKIPPSLRPERPPREPVARVTGILQMEGKQVVCEVGKIELLPGDLERLEKELARLIPKDPARLRWADWAARRGRAFKDEPLIARARQIETDALIADADRPGSDLLALAKSARDRKLGEPLAGAIAHKGFRERLASARTTAELVSLGKEVDSFFANAADPKVARTPALDDWLPRYQARPLDAYREAPQPVRYALDRRLLADIIEQRLERRAGESPKDTMTLADEARSSLPDRPEVATKLRDRGLAASESSVSSMRLSEVESLAKTFRDDGQPDRAQKLLRVWLDSQRKKLSPSDADGRVLLSAQYDRLLADRNTAAALLREALKVDPNSRDATDAFRRMGYKKVGDDQWVDSRPPAAPASPSSPEGSPAPAAFAPTPLVDETLRGLTPAQVRAKFGSKPDKIVHSATQDETIEQWTYQRPKGSQIINFRRPRSQGQPQVVSSYTFP